MPSLGLPLLAAALVVALGLPAAYERAASVEHALEVPSSALPWDAHIGSLKELSMIDRAHAVTVWGNRWLRYEPDQARGAVDEWASPLQSLVRRAGDCEDFAILKYGLLRAAGVPSDQVRLVYVMKQDAQRVTPHMVVALLAPGQSWGASAAWVLDNLTDEIFPLDQRADLQPVFSMGESGIWPLVEQGHPARPVAALRKWVNLLGQMHAEGFLPASPVHLRAGQLEPAAKPAP